MTTNSPKAGIPQAELTDAANIETYASALGTSLDQIVVPKYDSIIDRNAANPSPVDGDMCYTSDFGESYIWTSTASDWVGMRPRCVYKHSDTSRASNVTNTQDPELFMALEASSIYIWELFLISDSASSTPGMKVSWGVPSGSVMTQSWIGAGIGASSFTVSSVNMRANESGDGSSFGFGNINGLSVYGKGIITTSSTADTFFLSWSQQATSATASVMKAGSGLILLKIG